jgi:peptidoglycan/xylan/chitin deacetylase (PgdA/CDA1 family)
MIAITSLLAISSPSTVLSSDNLSSAVSSPCMCVVFRMDDVQDTFVANAQLEAMNLFISKDKPLSLGLIMNETGNNPRVVGKVGQGSQIGLFELAIHGWNHIDHTKLSKNEQKSDLKTSNEKMKRIFGNSSDIFIPPYGYFNNLTIAAISDLGIGVLSSALFSENNYDNGSSIFNSTDNVRKTDSNKDVYHIPGITEFKGYRNGSSIKIPVENILADVYDNINQYGYAVIVFHPQDLVQTDGNGVILDNAPINATEIGDLTEIIDAIESKGIKIVTLSDIAGIERRVYSYFR